MEKSICLNSQDDKENVSEDSPAVSSIKGVGWHSYGIHSSGQSERAIIKKSMLQWSLSPLCYHVSFLWLSELQNNDKRICSGSHTVLHKIDCGPANRRDCS